MSEHRGIASRSVGDMTLTFGYVHNFQKGKIFGPPENCQEELEEIDLCDFELDDKYCGSDLEDYFEKQYDSNLEAVREDVQDQKEYAAGLRDENIEQKVGW